MITQPTTPTACLIVLELNFGTKIPINKSFPLGLVSVNIQAKEMAIVAIRNANIASSFLTP
uniref:Uncharacterized protein n=1 Tax=Arundo donax TaxID=35708 RepID=A0A0A9DGP8_ARUDO